MGILMETSEGNVGTGSYRSRGVEPQLFGAMGTPSDLFAETIHTIAINTRETEFGSIVEPIPITLKTYKQIQAHGHAINGYRYPQQMVTALSAPRAPEIDIPSSSNDTPNPVKDKHKDAQKITRPPKKKWIMEYLEEEPASPVSVRVVTGVAVARGAVVGSSPPPAVTATVAASPLPPIKPLKPLDFPQEHSRPRTTSNSNGPPQIPSPPSVSSNGSSSSGSAPRAGTREVHNKLEKNRRAHLKECFELLKRQLPATTDDKKTSNLSILGSAIRYIQVLRRKERECEHEMERLAREKIAAQQRLAALKREVPLRPAIRPRAADGVPEEKDEINGHVVPIPISITSSPPRVVRPGSSPPRTLNLSTKLRTLPIQITPTTSQVVRTSYGARHNTLTLTTLAPADATHQNGQPLENGVSTSLSTTLVHPAHIHLPLSQMVNGNGVVVEGTALQLVSGGLRVLHHTHATHTHANHVNVNHVTHARPLTSINAVENNRIPTENGIVSPPPPVTTDGVMVGGLTPLVPAHLLHAHPLAHKMVETQVVKGGVTPLTVSAQYLSATTIVKPVVVVSTPNNDPPS